METRSRPIKDKEKHSDDFEQNIFRRNPFRSILILGMGYSETQEILQKEHFFPRNNKNRSDTEFFWNGSSLATLFWIQGLAVEYELHTVLNTPTHTYVTS